MVKLATQLVDRQTAVYEPADIEDRYETRLRAMLDAKLKGECETNGQKQENDRAFSTGRRTWWQIGRLVVATACR